MKQKNNKKKHELEHYLSLMFPWLPYVNSIKHITEIVFRDQHKEYFRYRNYSSFQFSPQNFTYEKLIKTIDPIYMFQLKKIIFLERKIILIQKESRDSAIIFESLFHLIKPL